MEPQAPRRDALARLREGEPVLTLGIRNARTAEIARLAAAAGYGAVWIDLEHSSMSADVAAQIAASAMDLGLDAWVRTPERDCGVIGRLLDGGAAGIIMPRVESAEEARRVVTAARFPPRGQRSQIALLPQLGFRRLGAADLMAAAEGAASVHILLESAAGIAQAEMIAAVDGVDMLHVGMNDLSVDLGHVGDTGHPDLMEACFRVIAAAKRHGKLAAVGGISEPAKIDALLNAGAAPLIFAGIDTDIIATGLVQRAQEWRTRLAPAARQRQGPIMSDEPLISLPMRSIESIERPRFAVPSGACDAHMHVFGPEARYPRVPKPHYTLPDGKLDHYRRLMPVLGLDRFVIVQPSFYGTDNACLLDALALSGEAARGVVMIERDIDDAELDRFHALGVRAVRLDLFKRAQEPRDALKDYVRATARRIARLGWHLQFYVPGYVVRDLIGFFGTLETDFVIDHMGYMLEEDGLTPADFARLLDLARHGHCWLKLSGPYRIAKGKGYGAVEHIAKAIVEAAPERAIWGSDWPHIPGSDRDTGELLNLLTVWAPDEGVRRQILVENPRRLFDFK